MRFLLWPMVVQALVNPTMRRGLPVLCRAVSQIVGDITSVAVGEDFVDLANSVCMAAGLCTRSVGGVVPESDILQCMEKIGFFVNATFGEFWTPRLQNLCSSHPKETPARFGRYLQVVDALCVHVVRVAHRHILVLARQVTKFMCKNMKHRARLLRSPSLRGFAAGSTRPHVGCLIEEQTF